MLCCLLAAVGQLTRVSLLYPLKQVRANLNNLNKDVTPPIVVEVNSYKQWFWCLSGA